MISYSNFEGEGCGQTNTRHSKFNAYFTLNSFKMHKLRNWTFLNLHRFILKRTSLLLHLRNSFSNGPNPSRRPINMEINEQNVTPTANVLKMRVLNDNCVADDFTMFVYVWNTWRRKRLKTPKHWANTQYHYIFILR